MDEENIDRISQLPTCILHNILFNLSLKREARTCILSKSWNAHVWSSLPQRNFDFMGDGTKLESYTKEQQQEFINRVDSSFQKLHSERFLIAAFSITLEVLNEKNFSCVDRWLEIAVKNGLRKLCIFSPKIKYRVPAEIALASAVPLKELALTGCWLQKNSLYACKDGNGDDGPLAIRNLTLVNVFFDCADGIFQSFISRCTSLKYLSIGGCHGVKYLQLGNHTKLKRLYVKIQRIYDRPHDITLLRLDVDSLSLRTIILEGIPSIPMAINFTRCRNLQHLWICYTTIEANFLQSLAINFPLLQTFVLYECYGLKSPCVIRHPLLRTIQLFRISFSIDLLLDTPDLRSLEHSSDTFRVKLFLSNPSFNLSTPRCFSLYLNILSRLCTTWFVKLRAYLAQLQKTNANVSFNLGLLIDTCMHDFDVDTIREGLPTYDLACDVKNMRISLQKSLEREAAFFDGLFWSCRPRKLFVELRDRPRKELLRVLHAIITTTREGDPACCKSCHVKCWRHSVKVTTINGIDMADTSLVETMLQNQPSGEEVVLTLDWY